MLRWPAEEARRSWCRAYRVPRLLVLDRGTPPPRGSDELEDWAREPVARADLVARSQTLRQRALRLAAQPPELLPDDALLFGDRRVPLAPGEARIVSALLSRYGSTVTRDELMRCGWPSGRTPRPNALDVRITRIRHRIEPLALRISAVWRRGYVLHPRTPPTVTSPVWESVG